MFGYPDKDKWKMFTQIRQKPDDCLLSTGTKRKQAGQNIWRMIEVSGLQYFRNCSYSILVLCFRLFWYSWRFGFGDAEDLY